MSEQEVTKEEPKAAVATAENDSSSPARDSKDSSDSRDSSSSNSNTSNNSGDDDNNKKSGRDFRKYKRKFCRFKANPELASQLHYTNTELLSRFISNRGKILPRRITGTSAYYQRKLSREIRRARQVGLLPYKVM